jgi:hypothetical protein
VSRISGSVNPSVEVVRLIDVWRGFLFYCRMQRYSRYLRGKLKGREGKCRVRASGE